ncbi:hypothetical protein M9H77_24557 [Catharanthus roseus]|uniref:Uncharacterized protein n=1 Tax=Catharanthus roseus TaxID=4058 RepID=A0ACC0AYM1_CATRO|nr:hypothetical protein M9H77_24557 [Catharanthus roseus]
MMMMAVAEDDRAIQNSQEHLYRMLEEAMILPFKKLGYPAAMINGTDMVYKNRAGYGKNLRTSMALQLACVSVSTEEEKSLVESRKITSSSTAALKRSKLPNSLPSEENRVGIIECVPFIVFSDPTIRREDEMLRSSAAIVENLKWKRKFLEQSGARCIVMPCHLSHVWHREVSEGCSVTFLNVGDCVSKELKEAKMKPLEAGSNVRIGVLARDATLIANFYGEKLENQGFEVVLPDKPTMEHVVIPAIEALNKRDIEGARNLLRVAIHILLVRAVNTIILASDEFLGLLPSNDPLLKKCIDPMDALARSTVQWAQSIGKAVNIHILSANLYQYRLYF